MCKNTYANFHMNITCTLSYFSLNMWSSLCSFCFATLMDTWHAGSLPNHPLPRSPLYATPTPHPTAVSWEANPYGFSCLRASSWCGQWDTPEGTGAREEGAPGGSFSSRRCSYGVTMDTRHPQPNRSSIRSPVSRAPPCIHSFGPRVVTGPPRS